jgi:tetratricopeptide (TPR) repeat protein
MKNKVKIILILIKHSFPFLVLAMILNGIYSCTTDLKVPNELIEARRKLERNPSDRYYFNYAWKLVRKKGENNWDAVANFEKAIQINSTNPGYYNDIANCYRSLGYFDSALKYYETAISKGFNSPSAHYNAAICCFETNLLTESCNYFTVAKQNGWNHDYYGLRKKANCQIAIIRPEDYLIDIDTKFTLKNSCHFPFLFEDIDKDEIPDLITIITKIENNSADCTNSESIFLACFSSRLFLSKGTFQLKRFRPYMFHEISYEDNVVKVRCDAVAIGLLENIDIIFNKNKMEFEIIKKNIIGESTNYKNEVLEIFN